MDKFAANYTIDIIGQIRANIAELNRDLKAHEAALKADGEGYFEGDLFAGSVSEVSTNQTDWKTVAIKAGASRQLIAGNTKVIESVRLTVTARKKAAA